MSSDVSNKNLKQASGNDKDEEYFVTPEFIYGGPFIEVKKPSPFMDTSTPLNLPLQGTFKRSFAYFSLRDRLPVILTKLIDYLAREGSKVKSSCGASDEDVRNLMQVATKLKNDLITNKPYDHFTVDTEEGRKWNTWIEDQENKKYFTNLWMFSECYVYRKLYEGCELSKGLKNFDYFEEQKNQTFQDSLEIMCLASEKVLGMMDKSEKDKRKSDFMTLLKLALWSNRCDLSLSCGAQVSLGDSGPVDPLQMIIDLKEKLLVDDTAKIADAVVAKAESMLKAIEGPSSKGGSPTKGSPAKGSPTETPAEPAEAEELPKIPCPAKMTIPHHVLFDVICDNSGYELFTDLCLAAFLLEQQIVQKVRFHVKKMPWFVSDVTPKDFKYVINGCMNASFRKEYPAEAKPEGEEGGGPKMVTSDSLKALGNKFNSYLQDGSFIVLSEDFWTYPHVYRDMKKYDPNMYRQLQFPIAIMFKGDLNYRKLLGDRNVNPYVGLEPCLQGFTPAPIIAIRTIKAELVCGLPKGKYEQLQKIDEHWMETGEYGLIQFCPKAEPLKPSERPCPDYGDTCRGVVCPEHERDM